MKKIILGTIFSLKLIMVTTAMEYYANTFIFNSAFGIGTFSAGEYDSGSVFLSGSLSADWIPNGKIGLSCGIETGLNRGMTQDSNVILGIPIIFRIGWYPSFIQIENIDIFIIGKIGWAFGIWGSYLDNDSTPDGIVAGLNIGGRYKITQRIGLYAEVGYNYYGLARNSNYPEYPLGYGSGKIYTSIGLSIIKNPRRKQRGIEDLSLKALRMRGNKSPAPPVVPPQGAGYLTLFYK
jgi:hypothetical protein